MGSKNASVTINEFKAVWYSGLKICFIEFNIQITADIAHNTVLFTLPDAIPAALISIDASISAVNQTSIKGRVFMSGKNVVAFGTLSANNYIKGSMAFPTY